VVGVKVPDDIVAGVAWVDVGVIASRVVVWGSTEE
jgi:hypothetical protein